MALRRRTTALVLAAVLGAAACNAEPKAEGPAAREPVSEERRPSGGGAAKRSRADERPMMVVVSRDFCLPCRVMKPWLDEIARENPAIDVVTVNIDREQYEHVGRLLDIHAVPTLVFAEADGQVSERQEGLQKKPEMLATLRRLGWIAD